MKRPGKDSSPTGASAAPTETISQARELMAASRHLEACELLERTVRSNPLPDLHCELATLYCYLQREDEAVALLPKCGGAERRDFLLEILSRYFRCRSLMAAKMGIADAKGEALGELVSKLKPGEPDDCGITLSACLIVKNEEKHLERCLSSLKGHVDEIVVIDTGSTDRTLEIAERFGAKIGHFEWRDDFSAARNESLKLATGHWALWIDADEEVVSTSWNAFAEGLIRPHFGGYYVQIVNLMDEEGNSHYVHSPVRLFQRLTEVQFEGRVHEQVLQCFDRLNLPCASLQNAKLIHYGYRPADMAEKGKTERTIRMLEREVEEAPEDAFHWFNLANAYSVARRRNDAIRAARKCLEHIHPQNAFGSLACQILASSLTVSGKPDEALEACEFAEQNGFYTILTQFEKAHALHRLERFAEALDAIDLCLGMEWPHGLTGDFGIKTHKSHSLKGQILTELGKLDEAEECLRFSLSVDPAFPVALYALGINLERQSRFQEALESWKPVLGDVEFGHPSMRASARVALALGHVEEAKGLLESAWRARQEDADAWALWTKLVEDSGDPSAMIECYQAWTAVQQPNADILVNWGRALESLGDVEGALDRLLHAMRIEPENANAFFNAGDLLYRAGRFAEAAEAYQAGIKLSPEHADGWFVLGNALAQMGIEEGAEIAYKQTLTLDPEHTGATHNMAALAA